MGQSVKHEPCPACRERGRDRHGDNLGRYPDGSAHCFSCGHHEPPAGLLRYRKEVKREHENTVALPRDFTREVPAAGWKWLLQYGLPYTYWKPFTGYSPADERVVLVVGNPARFSQGRYIGTDTGEKGADGQWIRKPPRKWFFYGTRSGDIEVLGNPTDDPAERVVLVEDLISAHKVAAAGFLSICLYGTNVEDNVIRVLRHLDRPVTLWLDGDQYPHLPKKINRLQTFLRRPVTFVSTERDPKEHGFDEIKEILKQ